ncbi:hypothetical protein [Paraburkholderia pallida]|uniref:Uncharacterized protein n=1 Tax=Paraburkholderia pallida TaxID=2547399 RepID=A0A4P7CSI1_9BURK|nr:hypothetical protein [Paraburkholderia pallida]QBQ97164.1 hypothetical protein E1956_08235 [Paraburkholderia pallida]
MGNFIESKAERKQTYYHSPTDSVDINFDFLGRVPGDFKPLTTHSHSMKNNVTAYFRAGTALHKSRLILFFRHCNLMTSFNYATKLSESSIKAQAPPSLSIKS